MKNTVEWRRGDEKIDECIENLKTVAGEKRT